MRSRKPGLCWALLLCFLSVWSGCADDNCWWEDGLQTERLSVSNQLSQYQGQQNRLLHLGRPLNPTEQEQYWRLERLIRQSRYRLKEIDVELLTRKCD